ncbi:MAG: hypothetical protein OXD33_14105 [Rhodobacteraceae bacterium]|nr:hypothetical protein [Paracoccaceae bacterium]MCY4328091.1 hypothetical protein [Paracoccaceae bacterium]
MGVALALQSVPVQVSERATRQPREHRYSIPVIEDDGATTSTE